MLGTIKLIDFSAGKGRGVSGIPGVTLCSNLSLGLGLGVHYSTASLAGSAGASAFGSGAASVFCTVLSRWRRTLLVSLGAGRALLVSCYWCWKKQVALYFAEISLQTETKENQHN